MPDKYLTGDVPQRTIDNGIFPFSARANAREGIFNDTLAAVLQSDPSVDVTGAFKDRVVSMDTAQVRVAEDVDTESIWEVFEDKYTVTTQGGNVVAIPFHHTISRVIEPVNSMNWGTWYQLHMTSMESGVPEFDDELHTRFKRHLEDQPPSNIFERAIISIAEEFLDDEHDATDPESIGPIRSYIGDLSDQFRIDLAAWLNNDVGSSSDWLRGCQELISIYFFMYYVQVSVNLRREWNMFINPEVDETYAPEVLPLPFGMEGEPAGLNRPFVSIWDGGRGVEFSVKRDIYDSWGRLAVMRILNEALADHDVGEEYPLTLTEAQQRLDEDSRSTALEKIYDHLPDDELPEDTGNEELVEGAQLLVTAIDNHYRYIADDVAPLSMGVRGIRRLANAEASQHYLVQTSGRPGFRFQMADETLGFLARVFASSETRDRGNLGFDQFVEFLRLRGFKLDSRSQTAARESLNRMGLLEQESDSGDTVNVRAY